MPRFKMLNDNVTAEILIMGYIGDEYASSRYVNEVLNEAEQAGAKKFLVKITSMGGDVFEGIAIFNALSSRDVITCVEGMAASAGSFIAMAGKTIKMYDNAMMMIHNPQTYAFGDAEYFDKVQKNLDMIKESVVKAYGRTGLEDKIIIDMMNEETWLNAKEAKEKKFCDEVIPSGQSDGGVLNAIQRYYNSIFQEPKNERKATTMVNIQNALGIPGANEAQIVEVINALKSAKSDADSKISKFINEAMADKAEIEDLKKKVKTLEDEKTAQVDAQENAAAETILNQAIKDGKLLPAQIQGDAKQPFLNIVRKNPKYFDAMPVVGPLANSTDKNGEKKTPVLKSGFNLSE